jgi:hypothetical protein
VTRRLCITLTLWLAAACAPAEVARCDITVTRELAFTSAEAPDTVTARAIGASCDKATLHYLIHDDDERPIWAWTSPMSRAFGDVFVADDTEGMRDFLESWAQPEVLNTGLAPEWGALAPGQTTLDQFTYDDIRARDLPMLCHFSGTARQTCVFWETAAGGAGLLFDRDVEETAE